MPGKKTTKLWVPDDEVSPETLVKVSHLKIKKPSTCINVDCSMLLPK